MNWEGLLSLNKPRGKTSHDVVEELRRILEYKKIGHSGTLDPQAEGLLLLCLGKALKIVRFLEDFDKEYIAKIKLGIVTDTYDREGKILRVEEGLNLEPTEVEEAVKSFQGEIEQTPPIYSALRHKGKRLYHYAREGREVERSKRKIHIKRIDQINVDLPYVEFKVVCSKGTYIRSLAFDIGEKLGCGACLWSLLRTKIGPFGLEGSLTIDEVKELTESDKLKEKIYSIEQGLAHLPAVGVSKSLTEKIRDGVDIKAKDIKSFREHFEKNGLVVIKDDSGKALAVSKALISSEEITETKDKEKIFEYRRVLI